MSDESCSVCSDLLAAALKRSAFLERELKILQGWRNQDVETFHAQQLEIERLREIKKSDDEAYYHVAEMCNEQLSSIVELEAEVERLTLAIDRAERWADLT